MEVFQVFFKKTLQIRSPVALISNSDLKIVVIFPEIAVFPIRREIPVIDNFFIYDLIQVVLLQAGYIVIKYYAINFCFKILRTIPGMRTSGQKENWTYDALLPINRLRMEKVRQNSL